MTRERRPWCVYREIHHRARGGPMRRMGDRLNGWGIVLLGIRDPATRINQQDLQSYLAAATGAITVLVTEYAIVAASALLLFASAWEYILERHDAILEDRWDENLASIRRTLKVNAFVQVWLLWGVEAMANAMTPWEFSTGGYVAVFACMVLVVDELDSLDRLRTKHGKRSLFGYDAFRKALLDRLGASSVRRRDGGNDQGGGP